VFNNTTLHKKYCLYQLYAIILIVLIHLTSRQLLKVRTKVMGPKGHLHYCMVKWKSP